MPRIVIYTTPTCGYCKMAKAYFLEHRVEYDERDVAHNMEARKEMIERSGQMGVPVIVIEGEVVVGFDQGRLADLLGIKA